MGLLKGEHKRTINKIDAMIADLALKPFDFDKANKFAPLCFDRAIKALERKSRRDAVNASMIENLKHYRAWVLSRMPKNQRSN